MAVFDDVVEIDGADGGLYNKKIKKYVNFTAFYPLYYYGGGVSWIIGCVH